MMGEPDKPENIGPDALERSAVLAHFAQNRLEQCYSAAMALTTRYPAHVFGWKVLGLLFQRAGDKPRALAAMRRAVQCAPKDLEAIRNMASMLQEMGEQTEAIAQYETVLRLNQADILAHNGLAQSLTYQGELPRAVYHFRQALALRLNGAPIALVVPGTPQPEPPGRETLLWQTLAQLAQAGVRACPMSGTLLGLQRDGQLLPFDKDMDVVLPFEDMARASHCLQDHGWLVDVNLMRLCNPLAFRHPASGNILDLCGVRLESESGSLLGGIWQTDMPWEWQRITCYPAFAVHQEQREFGAVWALDQPHAWLDALYGDWRTPDPGFDTVISARNLRGFALLTQCFGYARLNGLWQSGRLQRAQSMAQQIRRHLPQDELLQHVETHLHAAVQV